MTKPTYALGEPRARGRLDCRGLAAACQFLGVYWARLHLAPLPPAAWPVVALPIVSTNVRLGLQTHMCPAYLMHGFTHAAHRNCTPAYLSSSFVFGAAEVKTRVQIFRTPHQPQAHVPGSTGAPPTAPPTPSLGGKSLPLGTPYCKIILPCHGPDADLSTSRALSSLFDFPLPTSILSFSLSFPFLIFFLSTFPSVRASCRRV